MMKFKEIQNFISQIKKNGKEYYTNCYVFDSAANFHVTKGEESIVFFIREEFFNRAYYFTSNLDELVTLLMRVREVVVMDIICRGTMREKEQKALMQAGFVNYAIHCKKQYALQEGGRTEKDSGVFDEFYNPEFFQLAKIEDVQELKDVLYDVFDPITSHLPTKKQLIEMIQNQNVVYYKINGRIVALHVFLIQGKVLYSNISYNIASADVLYSMERRAREWAYEKYGVKWVYAWYDMTNEKALRRSVYMDTGQKNYIFVKTEE